MLQGRRRTAGRDGGISSVEYSLATAGVAGLVVVAVMGLGDHLAEVFDCMSRQLSGPSAGCGTVADGSAAASPAPGGGGTGGDPGSPPVTATPPARRNRRRRRRR